MKKPLRKIQFYESIQIGPTAMSALDVLDPNQHRRTIFASLSMELEDTTGLITIKFRGEELYVHISACRYAKGMSEGGATSQVTHYDPQAQDDDEPTTTPPPSVDEVPDEFDDPPVIPAPKPKRGRPRKQQEI